MMPTIISGYMSTTIAMAITSAVATASSATINTTISSTMTTNVSSAIAATASPIIHPPTAASVADVHHGQLLLADPISDQRARSFNEFVALEINRYVSKIAIVCPVQWHARLNNIFEPLSNQGKLVGMFQTIEEAKSWIQNQNAQ